MGLFSRAADVPTLVSRHDIEGLVKALRDDHTRDQAADAIVTLNDAASVRPLEKLAAKLFTGFDSNDAALDTLRRLGPDTGLAQLLELCAEGSRLAAGVVAGFGEDVALTPLIEMRGHEGPKAAKSAYGGLLQLGTERAMAPVVAGLERGPNRTAALRSVYVDWLGAEPEMIHACFAPFRDEPFDQDAEDSQLSSKILSNLAKRVREKAVSPERPIATFVELLNDPADKVRMGAAMMLIQVLPKGGIDQPDPRMADALERACADEYDGVRLMAAQALGRQSHPRAVGHLMALLDEGNEVIAQQAMMNIAEITERTGLPDEDGRLIVARYEEEGTRSRLGPNLAVTAGLVKQKARRERKAVE